MDTEKVCRECGDGEYQVADAVYAWCSNCQHEIERREVDI